MKATITIVMEEDEDYIDELYYQLSLKCECYQATLNLFKEDK